MIWNLYFLPIHTLVISISFEHFKTSDKFLTRFSLLFSVIFLFTSGFPVHIFLWPTAAALVFRWIISHYTSRKTEKKMNKKEKKENLNEKKKTEYVLLRRRRPSPAIFRHYCMICNNWTTSSCFRPANLLEDVARSSVTVPHPTQMKNQRRIEVVWGVWAKTRKIIEKNCSPDSISNQKLLVIRSIRLSKPKSRRNSRNL